MDSASYVPPSKRRKRQQRKACDLCRRRKVRCDIDEQPNNSCSVCDKSGLECQFTIQWARPDRRPSQVRQQGQWAPPDGAPLVESPPQSRRYSPEDIDSFGIEKQQARRLPNAHDIPVTAAAATSSPCSAASLLSQPSIQKEDFACSGLSRFFKHGINAAAWGVFDSLNYLRIAYVGTPVSNLVHLVQLHRASRRPLALGTIANIENPDLEDISIHSEHELANKVIHYPYPPIRPKNGWKPGPEVWHGMTTQDLSSDVSSFPAQEVRDALVAAYFEHVHPFHPVISMPEFMASYK
ncbi:hypothetical protein BDV12DRAFT_195915 [Aspergillus spectabilis]